MPGAYTAGPPDLDEPEANVDWSVHNATTSEDLTRMLVRQTHNNTKDLELITIGCGDYPEDLRCNRFLERLRSYYEVLSRDEDALNQLDFNVELYAVVLIYRGVYYGHIYTWISPVEPKLCVAMGVRNRVDSLFLKGTERDLPNVSSYLLEGVRRFGVSKGCIAIMIAFAQPAMIRILLKMGFQSVEIPVDLLGESISPPSRGPDDICRSCMGYHDIGRPIQTSDIRFYLLD